MDPLAYFMRLNTLIDSYQLTALNSLPTSITVGTTAAFLSVVCHLHVIITRSSAVVKRPCDCYVSHFWPNIIILI